MLNTDEKKWLAEARETVGCTFANFDLCFLVDDIYVSFNDRFTSKGGDANFTKKRIRLSLPLWSRMSEKERYETTVHETCHIVVRQKYGYRVKPHGHEWKMAMLQSGINPERCHNVDLTGLRQRRPRFPAQCACRTHLITSIKMNRILQGRNYMCIYCHSFLVPEYI